MHTLSRRWIASLVVLLAVVSPATADVVANIEQLKSDAFKELRDGHFDKSNELLEKASKLSPRDTKLTQMAMWTNQFEAQRQQFATQRQELYDKAVANVQLLIKHKYDDYAIDAAARAYLLAPDKKAFRHEKWVDDLIKQTAKMAQQYEATEQWVKALRLYSDLGSIEPSQKLWKDRLKFATRRVRLLAVYAPEELKAVQESEAKSREEVDALLNPTTQPTTKPTTQPESNDTFRVDWRDTLRDVNVNMLWDALIDARTNYYREVSYRQMTLGGLKGLQAIATTRGLEKAFPTLADAAKRQAFIDMIDESIAAAKDAATDDEQRQFLRSTLRNVAAINAKTLKLDDIVWVSEFADGAFAELDPFSNMIWPYEKEDFEKTTSGEFSGVGIQIQTDKDGSLRVVSPLEDSPAYKAGIKAGDIITQINGKSAKGITLNQAVKTITGASGTDVHLTVRSPDATVREYTIRRETIKVASVKGWVHRPGGGWDYFVDPEQRIGYLRITNFTKTSSDELDRAIHELRQNGGKGLIIDLRYNPGGLLSAATEICDKFLQEGVIVSTHADRETPNHPTVAPAKLDDDEVDLPLVVLVNQYSASASEIVSGALKDQKRALIVGERTFGKGSVQMLFPLSNRTALLKLTTSHYYLPSGRCIHREEDSPVWGVDPDLTVEMTPDQMNAAIDARQELDVLRDIAAPTTNPTTGPVAKANEDLLTSDPQLAAALLVLRLQLAGAAL